MCSQPIEDSMKRIHDWSLIAVGTLLTLFFVGCGDPVVGVYRYEWPGTYGQNSYTYDFRSDGTCVFTPYVSSYGGIITQGDVERDAVSVNKQPVRATWQRDGDKVTVTSDTGKSARFRKEGRDLIGAPSELRYVKIR
jgi:hypothetical protein